MTRRILRIAAFAALLVLVGALAAGCGGDDDDEEAAPTGEATTETGAGGEQQEFTIGVSLASPTIPLYVAMAEGIRDKAEELGVEVVFTEANEDPVQQLNDVQDLIAQDVDGILISPIDAEAAKPAYEDARAADVTIMSIARNTDPEVEDAFIGAPWGKFGTQIGEWACDNAPDKAAKVAMVKGPAGASFVEEMEDGFKQALEENCPDMEVVFENNNAPLVADKGLASAQDALTRNADIGVFFANNDDLAAGVIQALEEKGVAMDDVVVTGFDGTPEGIELAKAGKLDFTIALRPYAWGQLGLETMVNSLNGEQPAEHIVEIETITIDEESAQDVTEEEVR
jgi:ABC-type sugar transport system substrate-binding protein